MVYCDYVSNTESTVTYRYGASVDDITGVVIFHFLDDMIELAQDPKLESPPERHVHSLYGLNREKFRKGIFREKISYENG